MPRNGICVFVCAVATNIKKKKSGVEDGASGITAEKEQIQRA